MVHSAAAPPTICLNMIVRNETAVIGELLDAVAPYLSTWVIVDTGSSDGTPRMVGERMARHGVPGELHHRPWRNFGENRSEALQLAQGRGDYIWVIDADDLIVGAPDFTGLTADVYYLRMVTAGFTHWRPQLFRDGLPVRYRGAVHEYADWPEPCAAANLDGDYHIEARTAGDRSRNPQKYARDAELLLAEIERDPDDARSVFYLAQTYLDMRDFARARTWYARRIEMGGWEGEVFQAMYRLALVMHELREPWPDVQDAYLRAWEFRPLRAEPLYCIAHAYRSDARFDLGYLFARQAAEIAFPGQERTWVQADVYAWRALDEQAVCASQIGNHTEAFGLCRRLIARPDIPEPDRQRIAANRDVSVPAMIDAATAYPRPAGHPAGGDPAAEVTVSVIAGPDRVVVEQTLNSFLHCCLDVERVGRFLAVEAGLSAEDRALLSARYRFLEFIGEAATPHGAGLASVRAHVGGRYWLHLGRAWRFFAPENLITRLTAVLEVEPQVFQVAVNFADAATLSGACAAEEAVRRTAGAGRFVPAAARAAGPAMFDTARFDTARCELPGRRTATLDEVLCIAAN